MSRNTKRHHAHCTRLAVNFLKRLEAGIILDRTKTTGKKAHRIKPAPSALRRIA